jgi:hypothetical protein
VTCASRKVRLIREIRIPEFRLIREIRVP